MSGHSGINVNKKSDAVQARSDGEHLLFVLGLEQVCTYYTLKYI